MLPFLKRKDESGSASLPIDSVQRKSDGGEDYSSLHAAAEDLMNAIQSENISAIAEALRATFEICDAEPHKEEGNNS